jgi:hypothetical protein
MYEYTEVDDYLAHFGVKGMHWGQRKAQAVEAVKGASASAKTRYNNLSKENQTTVKRAGRNIGASVVIGAIVGGPLVAAGAGLATAVLTKNGKKLVKDLKG